MTIFVFLKKTLAVCLFFCTFALVFYRWENMNIEKRRVVTGGVPEDNTNTTKLGGVEFNPSPTCVLEGEDDNSRQSKTSYRRIAHNTLLLYIRMLLVMVVSLFTVRIVLQALGQVDYGLYNVVGGIVVMFSFLSHVLSSASQRFFAFELGRDDIGRLSRIYSIILMLYALVIVAIVLLAETVGLWFLHTHMTIPAERMTAVEWVYQLSIAAFCLQILTTPHKALIIAKERMNVYAYVGIVEVLLQLLLAYTLLAYGGDRLQLYAVLMFVVHAISNGIYIVYARRRYRDIRFVPAWDGNMVRDVVGYSGWTLFGALAAIARSQGINIVLNVYFGALVNAARGVAHQVNAAVSSFSNNFYTAVKPQIVKSYAAGQIDDCVGLVIRSTRFSFCLLLVLAAPVVCYAPEVLYLWLGDYPAYAVIFVRLMLVTCIVDAMGNPIITFNQATGNIRFYQVVVSLIYMLNIPIVIAVCAYGFSPVGAFVASMIVSVLAMVARLLVVAVKQGFPLGAYCQRALLPLGSLVVVLTLCLGAWLSLTERPTSLSGLVGDLAVVFVITAACSSVFGFTSRERSSVLRTIKRRLS